MKIYQSKDFKLNPTWLICRLDAQIQNQVLDIYFVVSLPTELILTYEIVPETISEQEVKNLINTAQKKLKLPKRIILAHGDPAEEQLLKISKQFGFELEVVPAPCLEDLIIPIKQSFGEVLFSPSSIPHMIPEDEIDKYGETRESLIASIPDSYSPCPCGSDKKYKFCCRPISDDISSAMVAAEDGHLAEALKHIESARKIVGTTGEILCREAIVYNYFDKAKSRELLERCLKEFPNHPRAYYIHGIDLAEKKNFKGAIEAYKTAISLYPPSDQYHLNEAYNNLGTAFYNNRKLSKAKEAWEKALFFIPSDKLARYNLQTFIAAN